VKRIILSLIALQLFVFSIAAQTTDREKLKDLNLQVLTNFKAGNIDGALTLAKQAVEMGAKVSETDDETAVAYFNLGALYRFKKKYKEASENLQKALSIYQLDSAKNGRSLAKTLSILGEVYALGGDEKKGIEHYRLAYTTAETVFGKDSKELLPYLEAMGAVYLYDKKYDEAQETFIRRYRIVSKTSPNEPKQLQEIEDDFYCFNFQYFKLEEADERWKKFNKAIQTERPLNPQPQPQPGTPLTVSGGVVNSASENLAKPEYPASAKERRATGKVLVQVTIDERGNIIEARAICGDKDLRIAAETAARKSKFKPTLLAGQPVRVTGTIVYNFVAAP
jgi:TonB family protein